MLEGSVRSCTVGMGRQAVRVGSGRRAALAPARRALEPLAAPAATCCRWIFLSSSARCGLRLHPCAPTPVHPSPGRRRARRPPARLAPFFLFPSVLPVSNRVSTYGATPGASLAAKGERRPRTTPVAGQALPTYAGASRGRFPVLRVPYQALWRSMGGVVVRHSLLWPAEQAAGSPCSLPEA